MKPAETKHDNERLRTAKAARIVFRPKRKSAAIREIEASEIPLNFAAFEATASGCRQRPFQSVFRIPKMGAKAAPLKSIDTSPLAGSCALTRVNVLKHQPLTSSSFTQVNVLIPNNNRKRQSSAFRTKIAGTRLTPENAEKLKQLAAANGLTPSEYVHRLVLEALEAPSDSKVILAYLELLTEDVARIETVVAYVVANLRVGNDLTAAAVDQFALAASKRKLGYAPARLEAAKSKARKEPQP